MILTESHSLLAMGLAFYMEIIEVFPSPKNIKGLVSSVRVLEIKLNIGFIKLWQLRLRLILSSLG